MAALAFGDRGVEEMFSRGWDELIARDSGPMHVRLILQPLVATILAIRSGLNDAREGRPVFFWTLALQAAQRRTLLRHLWKDVGKLFLVACLLDVVYQLLVLRWVYPVQTVIVATVLAILPYLVFRGLANRLGRRIGSQKSEKEGER
jgi:hypothetical protein